MHRVTKQKRMTISKQMARALRKTEREIHLDTVKALEKLQKIEWIIDEWENNQVVTNCYECAEQLKTILESED